MTEAYPLQWPIGRPRTPNPQRSRFDTQMSYARDQLLNELALMKARHVVLSTNIKLRQDGLPYANFKEPDDRGVAAYFEHKGKQVCFACDRWDLVKDNIQAIRHTINALRGIERWGTGDMVEAAFSGFEALPPPSSKWFEVLGVRPDAALSEIETEYKRRAKNAHPDNGGSADEMAKLNDAIKEARKG